MAIDLTREQRIELWQLLTPFQQETLQEFKRYQIQSLFLTENFLKDEEWLFVDFKENPIYPHGEEGRLFCRCGRELKYQFILASEKTGETLTLGSTHFSQHLGVTPKVAQQVQAGIHHLDRGVDLILLSVSKGLRFPRRYYNLFINRGLKKHCSSTFLTRLAAFAKADLPLYEEDSQELIEQLKKSGFKLETLGAPTASHPADNALKRLITLIQQYEIGEAIAYEDIAATLKAPATDLDRWLRLLETERFPIQLKKVNTSYYRIK
ncbi:hypothetical protein [Candidatus Enterococcus clewellii]|uniref:Uncharacterized protein n=1 Tax=Candidatus Enterococcus clewellii TaxID=1834193 RepID=A0A242JZ51_9ENTE|nr:hypothetical protein [Enterococcus sp. 9E7_DIV0242]OTP10599.1 hypothetical protein A5888_003897 [Enterococcus sp. 9E7_DIV0242]